MYDKMGVNFMSCPCRDLMLARLAGEECFVAVLDLTCADSNEALLSAVLLPVPKAAVCQVHPWHRRQIVMT
jgi:hypothetical protein